jgi:hypothetical protein
LHFVNQATVVSPSDFKQQQSHIVFRIAASGGKYYPPEAAIQGGSCPGWTLRQQRLT